ncbi:MAG: DUF3450 family protein [Verrucomicrobiales bacterium]|nr:DUF3450 family protein [Verrucomicrobiales bacterium]
MFATFRSIALLAWLAASPVVLTAQEATAPPAVPAAATPASVLQEKTREWIETRRLIGAETAAWEGEKASLSDLNAIRAKETAQLDEFVKAATVRVEELGKKKSALAKEESDLKAWRANLETDLSRLESDLRPLLKRLPAPLREKIQESLVRLESPEPDQPLQNRARDVLLVLQACMEFQNALAVDTEAREIDGERREVEVLYLGLTQAWYVDASGQHSGHGVPGETGWIWTQDKSIASQVRSAIEIQTRRATPAFVELPLTNAPSAKEEVK